VGGAGLGPVNGQSIGFAASQPIVVAAAGHARALCWARQRWALALGTPTRTCPGQAISAHAPAEPVAPSPA
jgi:hypothetical protein